jgi:uncharacterized protein YodC (DUF2158 family)
MSLKIGDTVQLKSGGPIMTIDDVFDDNTVSCTWSAGKQAKGKVFNLDTLQKVDPADKVPTGVVVDL